MDGAGDPAAKLLLESCALSHIAPATCHDPLLVRPADQEGLGETNEQYKEGVVRLQDFISCNEYSNNVCLVCLETIAPGAAVWTCRTSCFCMLHLVCAQGWANQQLKTAAAKAASQAANPDLYASGPWHALFSLFDLRKGLSQLCRAPSLAA